MPAAPAMPLPAAAIIPGAPAALAVVPAVAMALPDVAGVLLPLFPATPEVDGGGVVDAGFELVAPAPPAAGLPPTAAPVVDVPAVGAPITGAVPELDGPSLPPQPYAISDKATRIRGSACKVFIRVLRRQRRLHSAAHVGPELPAHMGRTKSLRDC
jgi:hypothetical protein